MARGTTSGPSEERLRRSIEPVRPREMSKPVVGMLTLLTLIAIALVVVVLIAFL